MDNLKEAYEGTKFKVFDLPIVIKINKHCTELDALIRQHDVAEWAFITAWNPYSKVLSDAENSHRHQQLVEWVKPYQSWEGEGLGTDASWKPERSLLILGISKNEAIALGTSLEQNAIVYGKMNEPAELLQLFDF